MFSVYIVFDEMEMKPVCGFTSGYDAANQCIDTLIAIVEVSEPFNYDGLSLLGDKGVGAPQITYWYEYANGSKLNLVTMHKVDIK